MDEPCDWDVCSEASTPEPVSQLLSTTPKRRRTKTAVPVSDPIVEQAVEHRSQRKPDETHPGPRRGPHVEENPRQMSSKREAVPPQNPPQAEPTRKELQDALPKITPLYSFKNCSSRFVSFEEAESDYQNFINNGLGRSVEVIRIFRGGERGGPSDQNGYRESVILDDDDNAHSLKQYSEQLKSDLSPQRSVSGSCSSPSDMEDDVTHGDSNQTTGAASREVTLPQTEATSTVHKPSATRIYDKTPCATSVRALSHHESSESESVLSNKASRQPDQMAQAQTRWDESKKIKKESKKHSKKMKGKPKRESHEEDCMETEEEWSSEEYWRAYYRAWSDYYSSMSTFQGQGYESYYSAADNWMAAYRMNAVYMKELMKH